MQANNSLTGQNRTLYIFLRYAVSLAMLFYGFAKLEGAQFTVLDSEIEKPLAQVNGFWLTWYYFSYSAFYGSTIALVQIACALLLMSRKTTFLAACLLLPIMVNIVLIDFCFGIGEGLVAAVLILTAVSLLLAFHCRVRPTPAPGSCRERAAAKCGARAEEWLLFFEPTRDGVTRDAERAAQTAPAGTLLLGAQNQGTLFFRVARRTGLGRRAPSALTATEAWAAVRRFSVTNHISDLTIRTRNNERNQTSSLTNTGS